MSKEGEYTINNLYQGGYSSLSPSYGDIFTGYHVSAGNLGMSGDPRTANILKDASSKVASGVKQIELSLVSPKIFDTVPKDYFKEVHRLSKLTGVDMSVHAPVMDSAGYDNQGHFSEVNREASERRIAEAVQRSHEVKPEGNGIVVFHSSPGLPGTEWEMTPDGRKAKRLIAVNRESGKMIPIETETRYYPGEDFSKVKPSPPEKELEIINNTEWHNALSQLLFNKERADEILQQNQVQIAHLLDGRKKGTIKDEDIMKVPAYRSAYNYVNTANNYLEDINTNINLLFSRAYKYGTPDQRIQLIQLSENFKQETSETQEGDVITYSGAMHNLLNNLQRKDLTPQMYVPIEEFTAEKSSQSFGNAAFEAYKKFGTKAPIMSIENPPAGEALSTGEDLKNLIEKSREQFVKKAVETGKLSESEARFQAKKLIGATWDVGHINMLRQSGATEKDIIKETEKIAPFVKHIHLSDNFGFEHTELPMGMGNVPIKEMLEKLPEKDVKKIIEAGDWWQHFSEQGRFSALNPTLESLGTPMYTTGTGPFWNQSPAFQEGYFSGYGMMLPSINYETFGTGFSRLPAELGGSRQGGGSRMGGTPME